MSYFNLFTAVMLHLFTFMSILYIQWRTSFLTLHPEKCSFLDQKWSRKIEISGKEILLSCSYITKGPKYSFSVKFDTSSNCLSLPCQSVQPGEHIFKIAEKAPIKHFFKQICRKWYCWIKLNGFLSKVEKRLKSKDLCWCTKRDKDNQSERTTEGHCTDFVV
jgi:hypothetical protein